MTDKFLVAIDKGERSKGYVQAAKKLGIEYKLVDCYSDNLMCSIQEADALCWHYSHGSFKDKRIASGILYAAEKRGMAVYPNPDTRATFDDKISQKYLLEAIEAPFIKTNIFYDKKEALCYLKNAQYPIVHKIAGGAGSTNVSLIKSFKQAKKICRRRFFSFYSMKEIFGNSWNPKEILHYILKEQNQRYLGSDKGYLYLQEFMPNNAYDIRVTIIGEKAVIFRRYTREKDFRASGSGKLDYQVSEEDLNAIPIAFNAAKKLKLQTCAFDFVYDVNKILKIVEMSFGFVSKAVSDADGYYTVKGEFVNAVTIAEEEVLLLLQKEKNQLKKQKDY